MKMIVMTLRYTFSESEMFCIFFLSSVEGLHAIVVSDRDGVPVIKGKTENLPCQCHVCFRIKMDLHPSSTEAYEAHFRKFRRRPLGEMLLLYIEGCVET